MTGLEIGMLVIGALCFAGSFFFTTRLTGSDLQEIQKLTEKEIGILIEKKFRESEEAFSNRLQEKVEEAIGEADVKTDKETNDKIMEIGEFSDHVLESMNKSHDEVMFLYNMLNEKQEKVTELTATLQKMESEIRYMEDALPTKPAATEPMEPETSEPTDLAVELEPIEEMPVQEEPPKTVSEPIASQEAQEEDLHSRAEVNQRIIDMHHTGFSEVEIAKKLGVGLGEVKLVLGLFN